MAHGLHNFPVSSRCLLSAEGHKVHQTSFSQGAILGLVGLMLFASGCQTNSSIKHAGLDNSGFMSLWQSYSQCKASADVSQALPEVQRLTEASRLQYGHEGFVLPLPAKLEKLVSNPTNRFAVDVRAMASACSLHTGQLAIESGHVDLARELFATVLALHASEESSYYRLQANTLLKELSRGVDISLKAD